jgi:hypothetical protein
MSHGLQARVSYNFAKSSDLGSSDLQTYYSASALNPNQIQLPPLAPSDFDIRNSLSAAVSYELPAPPWGRVGKGVLQGWAIDALVRVSSAPPLNVTAYQFSPVTQSYYTLQASIVPGQPYWIADSTQPAGKALNRAAFAQPPQGQAGNSPRNSLRDLSSLDQTDLAVRRRFNLTERVKLDIRAEYFNVFNHPMFGAIGNSAIDTNLLDPRFGTIKPGSTTNVALGGGGANGGQSFLYAIGGPRSGQFTVKLQF